MVAYFDKKIRKAEAEAAKQKSNPANAVVSAILAPGTQAAKN
jgi:hypothetical protein